MLYFPTVRGVSTFPWVEDWTTISTSPVDVPVVLQQLSPVPELHSFVAVSAVRTAGTGGCREA